MNGLRLFILTLLLFLYLLLGAVVFHFLEQENEDTVRLDLVSFRDQFLASYPCLSEEVLRNFTTALINARNSGVTMDGNMTSPSNWDFSSSFFFSGTVVTTIGYGNISPSTRGGQAFTIVYALIGIPLCGVVLAQMGTKINAKFKLLLNRVSFCLGRYETKSWVLPAIQATILAAILFGCGLIIPAAAFSVIEGWSFNEAWYFCFITVTTIGFGDYVVGTNSDISYSVVYKWFSLLWIFFGLVVMATIISKMTDWLSDKTENAKIFKKRGQGEDREEMGSDDSHGKLNGDRPEGSAGEKGSQMKEAEMRDLEMNKVQNGQETQD